MIKRPKKQLYSLYFIYISTFLIPIAGFFSYAIFFQTNFFFILAIALAICICILIPFRNRLANKRAEIELQRQDYLEKANLLESEIGTDRTAVKSFEKKIVNYSQLKGLTEKLSKCLTLEDTSNMLSKEVNRLFGDKGLTSILYIFHSKTGELGISASKKGQMRINLKSKKGDAFDQWVVRTMQPLLIEDTKSDFRFDIDKIKNEESRTIRSLMSVPLIIGHKTLGILRLDSLQEDSFTTEDLRFLTTIGDLSAVAIENAQLYERIEDLAIKDSLTGLYLRRYFLECISKEIGRHLQSHTKFSFLMIDLDKFKQYNDKYGHMAGDILLRTVAKIISKHFQNPGDLVCRYGGEEFSVLLPNCSKKKAIVLADEFRRKIESQRIVLRRQKTHITVSIGVAAFPDDAQLKDELIQKADCALYEAKKSGRNRVCAI